MARLAELVRSLASLLLELLSALPALAEMLLAIPDLPGPVRMSQHVRLRVANAGAFDELAGALLCAASTSPATLGNSSSHNLSIVDMPLPSGVLAQLKNGGLLSSSVSFVVPLGQHITVLLA